MPALTGATVSGSNTTDSSNGDGLRLSQTAGGTTTTFIWDLAGALPTVIDDGTQYVYGLGPGPSERISGSSPTYYLPDGLGSTLAVANSSGSVVESYSYDAYGNATASGSQPTAYQFAGQETDANGLQYLRQRYYDPTTGRFLGRDRFGGNWPLGGIVNGVFNVMPDFAGLGAVPQSLNRYIYGEDSPTNVTDPTGLFCFSGSCLLADLNTGINYGRSVLPALAGASAVGAALAACGSGIGTALCAAILVEGGIAAGAGGFSSYELLSNGI